MRLEPEFNEGHETQLLGHQIVSERGGVLGTVTDVLMDEVSSEGAWAVIRPGRMRSERFVPLAAAYLADDGNVVVPYDKNTIKNAPRASEHTLDPTVRGELAEYYGPR